MIPAAADKAEELRAMDISCDAAIIFAERHAELAEKMATAESDPERKAELERIAATCRRVPARAPRDFMEALQTVLVCTPGHHHRIKRMGCHEPGASGSAPASFLSKGPGRGSPGPREAKELMECFWIKVNNQPAPPKVGVTALESGTYNDFTNINIGGCAGRCRRRQ